MIEVRCKFCYALNLEVSEDFKGTLQFRCKRGSCGRWVELTMPLKAGQVVREGFILAHGFTPPKTRQAAQR